METEYRIYARTIMGAVMLAGLLLVTAWMQSRQRGGARVQRLLEQQLHYGLVGVIAGYVAPVGWHGLVVDGVHAAGFFLLAWFGLLTGMGLDRRLLRTSSVPLVVLDAIQAGVVAGTVFLAAYGAWRLLAVHVLPVETVFMLVGVCAALSPRLVRIRTRRTRTPVRSGWFSLAACTGALIYGLGAMSLRGGGVYIELPAMLGERSILIYGPLSQTLGCLILGCLVGLILDLLTRDARRRVLLLLIASSLALGGGLAIALGLDPVLTGIAAGAWLINSTLRRLEITRSVGRAELAGRIGLFLVAGCLLGAGAATQGISLAVLAGFVVILTVVRSLGLWGGALCAQWLTDSGWVKGTGRRDAGVRPHLDILALALALSLVQLVPGSAGTAALGGVMSAQWILSLVAPVEDEDRPWKGIAGGQDEACPPTSE